VRIWTHLLVFVAVSTMACESTPATDQAARSKPDPRRCKPGAGATGSPNTIEEAVALANGLPFPVTAQCFVEALDRPLRLEATASRSSAQPAAGERSPRLFLWTTDTFVITVAIDGPGRDLIEFGQFVTPRRSVKGELEFPLSTPASATDPLERVRNEEFPRITTCFVCHDREQDEPSVPRGRSSLALRPHPSTLVNVDALRGELDHCDETAEPDRCRWLHAVFDHGPVEHRPFDPDLPVF
jgi:hypothetical protein